ncbi:response regulator transcription factor [Polymorphospora rubra]|uniref:DNA-binding response regulator n=1 Tax=Polymorphospora rubra TaxID=338584 RepID=A0A810N3W8_9ACTN|nr:response regulator transcription factor [Polymorphospora rubra]BCJ68086.1 DNA-binding response regulator [Polymorphospora rubra]
MRIVIAEDAALLREGLTRLLTTAGHEVVAAVSDGDTLLDAVRTHRPDLTVIDVRMPPTHTDEGIRAAHALRLLNPAEPILVLSQIVSGRAAADLLTTGDGGIGYLLKDRVGDIAEFLRALETVASGGEIIDPEVVRKLLRRRSSLDELTPRESEVLALMAEGRTNTAIAKELVITDAAVAKHINRIFAKLNLGTDDTAHKRVHAVLTYLRQ